MWARFKGAGIYGDIDRLRGAGIVVSEIDRALGR
jgi:hypothetical protein